MPSDHLQVPSLTASVAPIHAKVLDSAMMARTAAFSAALWMLARSPPRAWHAARPAAHVPRVGTYMNGEGEGGGGEGGENRGEGGGGESEGGGEGNPQIRR